MPQHMDRNKPPGLGGGRDPRPRHAPLNQGASCPEEGWRRLPLSEMPPSETAPFELVPLPGCPLSDCLKEGLRGPECESVPLPLPPFQTASRKGCVARSVSQSPCPCPPSDCLKEGLRGPECESGPPALAPLQTASRKGCVAPECESVPLPLPPFRLPQGRAAWPGV